VRRFSSTFTIKKNKHEKKIITLALLITVITGKLLKGAGDVRVTYGTLNGGSGNKKFQQILVWVKAYVFGIASSYLLCVE
jgi:hypothetical protein